MNTEMMESKLQTVHPADQERARYVLTEMTADKLEWVDDCVRATRRISMARNEEELAWILYEENMRRGEIEVVYLVAERAGILREMVKHDCELDLYAEAIRLSLN